MTASDAESDYPIRGGRTDAQRLARQAHVMGEATLAFLRRAGVGSGTAFLDVGCGTGPVAIAVAALVGEDGRVVGADVDEEALAVARENATQAGVKVRFVRADAAVPTVDGDAEFDLAFARLVLSYLTDAQATVRAMSATVRPGGTVAIEDIYTGTLRSDPPTAALDDLQEIYGATVRAHGGDPTIGPRLPAMLRAAGLADVREASVSNLMTEVDDKLFLAQLLDNMRDAIVGGGVASDAELERVRAAVERAARDPSTVFRQARMHQVSGRRPSR